MATTPFHPSFHFAPGMPEPDDKPYVPPQIDPLPNAVNLALVPPGFPAIYDQGVLNSCTANAIAAALAYDMRRQLQDDNFAPSRLYIYYNERYLESALDTPRYGNHGAPAYMKDCIATIDIKGFCDEQMWPYDAINFDTAPPDSTFTTIYRGCDAMRIDQQLHDMKTCLVEGYSFVCGIAVHQSYLAPTVKASGNIPLPEMGEQMIGGHAIAVVGYDDTRQVFLFRNSFGTAWGSAGYGTIPYGYLTDSVLAMDFWTIRKVIQTVSLSLPVS